MPEESTKASLLLRLLAKAVDLLVIAMAAKLIPQVGYLSGLVYLIISDGFFDGSSIGKKLLRLRVITGETGRPCSFKESVIRNAPCGIALLMILIPFLGWVLAGFILTLEVLLMLGNREGLRLGDELAHTKVIEVTQAQ
jgi:uncharacterized RDD family membrane protein YckC